MTNAYRRWLDHLDALEEQGEVVDPRARHDEELERLDRVREFAEQPHPRERKLHRAGRRDELDARLTLYPSRRQDVTPLGRRAA